jgi:hypothetical protein
MTLLMVLELYEGEFRSFYHVRAHGAIRSLEITPAELNHVYEDLGQPLLPIRLNGDNTIEIGLRLLNPLHPPGHRTSGLTLRHIELTFETV